MTGRHGTVDERFQRYVDKSDTCWVWTGSGYPSGYGALKVEGSMRPAHRVSWVLHRGDIPEGMFVCHTCDNRRCVNPDHLFLGTNADNMADMVKKGRKKYYGGHPPRKLTPDDLKEIRALYAAGALQRDIAKQFGVVQATISRSLSASV